MESELPEQARRVDATMFMLRVKFGWRLHWISAGKRINFGCHSQGVSLAKGVKSCRSTVVVVVFVVTTVVRVRVVQVLLLL